MSGSPSPAFRVRIKPDVPRERWYAGEAGCVYEVTRSGAWPGCLRVADDDSLFIDERDVAVFADPVKPASVESAGELSAGAFLSRAAALLTERGKQYDAEGGERSMGKTVAAFNAITGRSLTESEGWLLILLLKQVRQWTTPGKFHRDSAEDGVSYAALLAESLAINEDRRDA